MATSGKFSKLFSKGYTLEVRWAESDVNIAGNHSDLLVEAWLIASGTYYINSTVNKTITLTINGTDYSGTTTVGIGRGESKKLFSQTVTNIPHNADGSKTVSITCTLGIKVTLNDVYVSSVSTSGTAALTTIARASQPSCVTYPNHTQNVGSFGDTISIHMNRAASAFTHTVRYAFGSRSGTIATGVGTGTTWKIPESLMELLPSSTSGSGTIYVDTYNGSTLIGTKYCGFTATVPASVKPTCTMTLEDVSTAGDIYGSPVRGLSQIKVTVNATQAYKSPIQAYSISINGAKYNAAEITSDVLSTAGASPVVVTVTDQRGRSGSASYTMQVQDYKEPAITALSVGRCDADGTENDQGEYVSVTISATIASMSGKNTAAYKLRRKASTDTAWTEQILTALAGKFTVSGHTVIFAAEAEKSYDVEVVATDRHRTSTLGTSASTAFSIMDWGDTGRQVAFGKVAEKDNTVEFAMDVEFLGKIAGTIFDAILPVGSIIMRYDHTDPAALYPGTVWVRIENRFLWAADSKGQIGREAGSATVTLTTAQLPSHTHGAVYSADAAGTKNLPWLSTGVLGTGDKLAYGTVATGAGEPHDNMPPFVQVSAWRRTA